MGLDVMWPELNLYFRSGDGTGCNGPELKLQLKCGDGPGYNVARAEAVVQEWRWDWM